MNQGTKPLLLSLAVTFLSLAAGLVSYGALRSAEESQQLVLGTIPKHPVTYVIKNHQGSSECSGSLDMSIDTGNNQAFVLLRGWMLVSAFGKPETVTVDASLVFNALGQLSASVFRTFSRHESIRFGTMGVNPITAQLYNTPDGTAPLFEQTLPGPIELKPREGRYELVAPQYRNVIAPLQHISLPVALEVAAKDSGRQETAQPIDLTSHLHMAASLSDKVRKVLPAL